MARLPRAVFPGHPHFVSQQGTSDRPVFGVPADFKLYLGWLREYTSRYGVEIWAYCLMPNSVDFVCVPTDGMALSRAFNTIHMRYAQYVRGQRSVCLRLWETRFRSCAMDEPSAYEAVRLVETIPVRSGLVANAEDYPWSSANAHVSGISEPILCDPCPLGYRIRDWKCYLAEHEDAALRFLICQRLKTGRPAGDVLFIRELETLTGRRLDARPRGRPRKNDTVK